MAQDRSLSEKDLRVVSALLERAEKYPDQAVALRVQTHVMGALIESLEQTTDGPYAKWCERALRPLEQIPDLECRLSDEIGFSRLIGELLGAVSGCADGHLESNLEWALEQCWDRELGVSTDAVARTLPEDYYITYLDVDMAHYEYVWKASEQDQPLPDDLTGAVLEQYSAEEAAQYKAFEAVRIALLTSKRQAFEEREAARAVATPRLPCSPETTTVEEESPAPSAPVTVGSVRSRPPRKHAWIAVLLNCFLLVMGLGYLYIGRGRRFVVVFLIQMFSSFPIASLGLREYHGYWLVVVWLVTLVDVYYQTKAANAGPQPALADAAPATQPDRHRFYWEKD